LVAPQAAGVASGVVVAVIIGAGFLVYVPVTSTAAVPYLFLSTSTVVYTTTSTTLVPVVQQTTATAPVFGIPQTTLQANYYTSSSAQLSTGTDVGVSWSSDDTVDVYIFSSSQFRLYEQSGTTSPNIASQTALSSGTIGFHVSFSDTYTLVLHNPHTGFFGLGAHNIGVAASGTETYPTTTTTYITQIVTYTTSSTTPVTLTLTSTTTKTCSFQFWNWLVGSKSCL